MPNTEANNAKNVIGEKRNIYKSILKIFANCRVLHRWLMKINFDICTYSSKNVRSTYNTIYLSHFSSPLLLLSILRIAKNFLWLNFRPNLKGQ